MSNDVWTDSNTSNELSRSRNQAKASPSIGGTVLWSNRSGVSSRCAYQQPSRSTSRWSRRSIWIGIRSPHGLHDVPSSRRRNRRTLSRLLLRSTTTQPGWLVTSDPSDRYRDHGARSSLRLNRPCSAWQCRLMAGWWSIVALLGAWCVPGATRSGHSTLHQDKRQRHWMAGSSCIDLALPGQCVPAANSSHHWSRLTSDSLYRLTDGLCSVLHRSVARLLYGLTIQVRHTSLLLLLHRHLILGCPAWRFAPGVSSHRVWTSQLHWSRRCWGCLSRWSRGGSIPWCECREFGRYAGSWRLSFRRMRVAPVRRRRKRTALAPVSVAEHRPSRGWYVALRRSQVGSETTTQRARWANVSAQ